MTYASDSDATADSLSHRRGIAADGGRTRRCGVISTLLTSTLLVVTLLASTTLGCNHSTQGRDTASTAIVPRPTTTTAVAGEPLPFLTDYDEAVDVATSDNKPLLVLFTTDNCVYSARMKAGAFTDSGVRQLASHFVCVVVDAAESRTLCKEYEVSEFPTIQFIDASGLRLARLVGQQTPNSLLLQMHVVLQTVAGRRQLAAQSEVTRTI